MTAGTGLDRQHPRPCVVDAEDDGRLAERRRIAALAGELLDRLAELPLAGREWSDLVVVVHLIAPEFPLRMQSGQEVDPQPAGC